MLYPNQPYPNYVQLVIDNKIKTLRFSETASEDDIDVQFRYLEGFLDGLEIQYGYDSVTRVLLSTAVDAAINAAKQRSRNAIDRADPVNLNRPALLEVVRVALSDPRTRDILADELDLSDEALADLLTIANTDLHGS